MKRDNIFALSWLAGSLLCIAPPATADDAVPCLIFTGKSDIEHCIDLAKLNRITFDNEGMTISSSSDNSVPTARILYSLFHHLEIGDRTPSETSGIQETGIESDSKLRFQADTKTITLDSTSDRSFSIGVFSINGNLMTESTIYSGQNLSVNTMPPGVYIAIAIDGKTKLTLKFILN